MGAGPRPPRGRARTARQGSATATWIERDGGRGTRLLRQGPVPVARSARSHVALGAPPDGCPPSSTRARIVVVQRDRFRSRRSTASRPPTANAASSDRLTIAASTPGNRCSSTMSEAELHLIRSRLRGGLENKARRGDLHLALPIGLERDEDGEIRLALDEQV